jgi:hypothetical protein
MPGARGSAPAGRAGPRGAAAWATCRPAEGAGAGRIDSGRPESRKEDPGCELTTRSRRMAAALRRGHARAATAGARTPCPRCAVRGRDALRPASERSARPTQPLPPHRPHPGRDRVRDHERPANPGHDRDRSTDARPRSNGPGLHWRALRTPGAGDRAGWGRQAFNRRAGLRGGRRRGLVRDGRVTPRRRHDARRARDSFSTRAASRSLNSRPNRTNSSSSSISSCV